MRSDKSAFLFVMPQSPDGDVDEIRPGAEDTPFEYK